MQPTHTELLHDVNDVTDFFSQLGEKLSEAAADLRVSGTPPAPLLVEELTLSRNTFEDLRQRAVDLAVTLAATPRPREAIHSLKELKSLLQSLDEAEEKRKAEDGLKHMALGILNTILALRHREEPEFAPLRGCQEQAGELRRAIEDTAWPQIHPDMKPLATRRHPLSEFLTLIEGFDTLDDDLWLLLKHAVAESFGKALSLAAARGKIILSEGESPQQPPDSLTNGSCENSQHEEPSPVTDVSHEDSPSISPEEPAETTA